MKKGILRLVVTLFFLTSSCQANSSNTITGAVVLGVITAFSNIDTKTFDEVIDYKSYQLNQKYKITVSQKFVDVKGKVGITHQYKQILDIPKSDKYEIVLSNKIHKNDFLEKHKIAISSLTETEKMLGEQEESYYVTFDKKGKLIETDYPLLTNIIYW